MSQELVAKRLRRPGGEMCSPPLVPALGAWIHPTQRADFLWGYVPIAARDWAASRHYDPADTSSLCSALYAAVATVHDSVWKTFLSLSAEKGATFVARAAMVYGSGSRPARDPVLDVL